MKYGEAINEVADHVVEADGQLRQRDGATPPPPDLAEQIMVSAAVEVFIEFYVTKVEEGYTPEDIGVVEHDLEMAVQRKWSDADGR